MNIILIGPPGTGKGTIAKMVEAEFGFKHVSAGDLLREEVEKKTGLGRIAAPIMAAGKLVDDDLVARVISANVPKYIETGFVLDGFPRHLKQAEILEKLFLEKKVEIDLILLIDSKDANIVKRLGSRLQCPKCKRIYGGSIPSKKNGVCNDDSEKLVLREDDKPQVIKKRLELYHSNEKELIGFYSGKITVTRIDGNGTPKKVFKIVKEKILEKKGND